MFDFLKEINSILQKDKREVEFQKQNGDCFNLFNVLNLRTKELIHSSMLAELLNPSGCHGKGSLFLQKFLSIWNFELDINTASIMTEYDIGQKTNNNKSGGRIDILVTDKDNHAIIIENKIYAADQKNQLIRYADFAKSKKWEYTIVYLTLDGHEPSDLSVGKNNTDDYVMFSYQEDILPWLDECMDMCVAGSALHSSINQYSQCLRKLLNLMNKDNEKRLLEIATRNENIDSVLTLFANENSIKKKVVGEFVEKLCAKARELGYKAEIDKEFCEGKDTYITLSLPAQSSKWVLFIGTEKGNAKDLSYGICLLEGASSKIKKTDLQNIPHLWEESPQDKTYPCGWSWVGSESGVKYSGDWHNWYAIETLQAMVDGRLLKYITENVLIPVVKSKVLSTLDKL